MESAWLTNGVPCSPYPFCLRERQPQDMGAASDKGCLSGCMLPPKTALHAGKNWLTVPNLFRGHFFVVTTSVVSIVGNK